MSHESNLSLLWRAKVDTVKPLRGCHFYPIKLANKNFQMLKNLLAWDKAQKINVRQKIIEISLSVNVRNDYKAI